MKRTMEAPKPALLSPAHATKLLDSIVQDRVRELIDFCGLLEFEQELWRALEECGVTRVEVPAMSAAMLARALTRIGEEHVKLATEFELGADDNHRPTESPS